MKHHIKAHYWLNNILQTLEMECESLKHAMKELKKLLERFSKHQLHACKIHSESGGIVWGYHCMEDQHCPHY